MSLFPVNTAIKADLSPDFLLFLEQLHRKFTRWQEMLRDRRREALRKHLTVALTFPRISRGPWKAELPARVLDQRNQMTGPADDGELVVKMLNSGAPGVMIDLEDSMANTWDRLIIGLMNTLDALQGELAYTKKGTIIGITPSNVVTWVRPRGLHMSQHGVLDEPVSASLFDLAWLVYHLNPAKLPHGLYVYIPKSESGEEAIWWRRLFETLAELKGQPRDWIKCMALVESFPLAYDIEEFLFNLRPHILGLNLGRWDYMASLLEWNLHDPQWILPDRDSIPHDVSFFQELRKYLVRVCHYHGLLAIGGMTALFPDRLNPVLNQIALGVLALDKGNEAALGFDGAWTGHPDQNDVALDQFKEINQLHKHCVVGPLPQLNLPPLGVGAVTLAGTRRAIRTVILYRAGVLNGRGASLLRGPKGNYMEDLATDRIYRLMLAQRFRHRVPVMNDLGQRIKHSRDLITKLFRDELSDLLAHEPTAAGRARLKRAAILSRDAIFAGNFNPA